MRDEFLPSCRARSPSSGLPSLALPAEKLSIRLCARIALRNSSAPLLRCCYGGVYGFVADIQPGADNIPSTGQKLTPHTSCIVQTLFATTQKWLGMFILLVSDIVAISSRPFINFLARASNLAHHPPRNENAVPPILPREQRPSVWLL